MEKNKGTQWEQKKLMLCRRTLFKMWVCFFDKKLRGPVRGLESWNHVPYLQWHLGYVNIDYLSVVLVFSNITLTCSYGLLPTYD